jgi:ribosomal protein L32E
VADSGFNRFLDQPPTPKKAFAGKEVHFMRKPSYRFARAERDWTKQAKKEEKARRQQEQAPPQRSGEADEPVLPTASDDGR